MVWLRRLGRLWGALFIPTRRGRRRGSRTPGAPGGAKLQRSGALCGEALLQKRALVAALAFIQWICPAAGAWRGVLWDVRPVPPAEVDTPKGTSVRAAQPQRYPRWIAPPERHTQTARAEGPPWERRGPPRDAFGIATWLAASVVRRGLDCAVCQTESTAWRQSALERHIGAVARACDFAFYVRSCPCRFGGGAQSPTIPDNADKCHDNADKC